MYDKISAFVGVQYSVYFQNARCNNKDNVQSELYGHNKFDTRNMLVGTILNKIDLTSLDA
jgi:hypothetical protein